MESRKPQRVMPAAESSHFLVIIQVDGAALTGLFNEQLSSISALIGAKKIESISVVNDSNIEEGYAVVAVNSEVNVLLLVKVYFIAKGLG